MSQDRWYFQFYRAPFDAALLRMRAVMRGNMTAVQAFRDLQAEQDAICVYVGDPGGRSGTIYPSDRLLSLIEMFEQDQDMRNASADMEYVAPAMEEPEQFVTRI